MTGRIAFRQAMALAGLLLASACALPNQAVETGFATLVSLYDTDHDGMLDRAEVTVLVEALVPPTEKSGPIWDGVRAWLVADYFTRDCDGDGKLTAAEIALVRGCGATSVNDFASVAQQE